MLIPKKGIKVITRGLFSKVFLGYGFIWRTNLLLLVTHHQCARDSYRFLKAKYYILWMGFALGIGALTADFRPRSDYDYLKSHVPSPKVVGGVLALGEGLNSVWL